MAQHPKPQFRLADRFGAQWLRLQDIKKNRPDPLLYPQWDDTLADAFKRETELFFDSIARRLCCGASG